jgi:peroxiredoxin Q/BCP
MSNSTADTQRKGRVQVGDQAPDFTLPNQSGTSVSLHDLRSKNVVLYFYPKDNTSGCTAQACAFRDQYEVFKDAGAEVIGVSSDSEESHQQFAAQYRLPFTLLSDAGGTIRKLYGAMTMGMLPGRVTYVIDKNGVVRHVFSSAFNAQQHITEAVQALQTL